MSKVTNSGQKLQPNAARHGPSQKRIVRGKGATAANPASALEAKEKAGGLKGPRHG